MGIMLAIGLLGAAAYPTPSSLVDIQVKDAWIRWLPANLPAGGYMTMINTASAARVLIGASSPDYAEISFHRTRTHNGSITMTPVAAIELKSRIPVQFAEGGYHLMLMQPKRSVQPGQRVLVTFRFADGQSIEVPFEVRAANAQ